MKKSSFCNNWIYSEKGKEKEKITLPHDAMQQQGRKADAPSGKGGAFFLGGCYVYEKKFWAPDEWKEQDILLEFEGVYPTASVFLNDKEIGGCKYGYSMFRVPLCELKYNDNNDLRVVVDNSKLPNSRWYSGAGIYRPVWLLSGNKEHIEPDGIRITTLSYDPAEIKVEVTHTKSYAKEEDVKVEISYKNHTVAEGKGTNLYFTIPDAHLWDAQSPELYRCIVNLENDGEVLDSQSVQFGIRKLEWSPKGLTVNGKEVLLKGGCIHHDNGILGARSYDQSEWRRIKRLKENGYNAIRSSHNPLCRGALEACDVLGMYVMDETWDMWYVAKNPEDYAKYFMDNYETDLISIVAKDFNHPSVIMYSIGNEVTEPAMPEGQEFALEIIQKLRKLDATRPITAGINLTLLLLSMMENNPLESGEVPNTEKMNSTSYNQMVTEMGNHMTMAAATEPADKISAPVFNLLDIAGYNYAVSRYELESELHPERIVVGSETYTYDLAKTWKMVEKYPYLIGDFMWSAWDYLGEVGIGSWSYDADDVGFNKSYPWLLADAGAFDILGNDNAAAGAASVVWGIRKTPYIGVRPVNHPGIVPSKAIWRGTNALPYWSYQGCDGNTADVEVYSSAYEVELVVNGSSVKRAKLKDYKAEFQLPYETGTLKAIAYNEDGTIHSQSKLISADAEVRIWITQEEDVVKKGDILYLDISIIGKNGVVECNRDAKLQVTVKGGELLAFGSANPRTEEDFLTGEYKTYYGRSQAIVKVTENQLNVSVAGEGLGTANRSIAVLEGVYDEQ